MRSTYFFPRGENRAVTRTPLGEVELEARFEAAPAIAFAMGVQIALAVTSKVGGWSTWSPDWWMWLLPLPSEAALFVLDTWHRPHRKLQLLGIRREVGITLLGLTSAANAVLVVSLIGSILAGHEDNGTHLLLKGGAVWTTNVIVYGLWFWLFDRGGPVGRRRSQPPRPDFQFPQLENPQFAAPDWSPRFVDYMYVSFTNSVAFSPTDAMPLTRWAKLLMLSESAISALVVLLVAARSVNILT
jgi:hypothetical protein